MPQSSRPDAEPSIVPLSRAAPVSHSLPLDIRHQLGSHLSDYDLVILGSGSAAFSAALTARSLGKSAVMTEERMLGGTCVNRGCLPSKNLIEAAKLVFDSRNPRYPGLDAGEGGLKVDFATLIAQKDDLVQRYREQKYDRFVDGDIALARGQSRFVDAETVAVGDTRLTGRRFLVATGSRPIIPDIPGLDRVPYLTSDLLTHGEETELRELPESLIVVGGGYIGLELGQMFARFGSRVTILERAGQLLPEGYEPQLGRTIGRLLAEEGISVLTNASAESVEVGKGGVVVAKARVAGSDRELTADRLLVATGRRPNTDRIGLDAAGVRVGRHGEVDTDEHLRTSVPHIFAAGDVIGSSHASQMATPVAARQGSIAATNALDDDNSRTFDGRVVPRVIFTDPQIATVGLTEAEVIAAGHRCWCTTLPMDFVPRAAAIRDMRGLIKMSADAATHEVLGVSMIGANAGEVIHEAAMAMRFHAKAEDFVDLIHVYPTMAEALKLAAISRTKDPRNLPCCTE